MKTIGYLDRTEGKTIHKFFKQPDMPLFFNRQKRSDRIKEALKELEHMGNIEIYLINGNKQRLIKRKA